MVSKCLSKETLESFDLSLLVMHLRRFFSTLRQFRALKRHPETVFFEFARIPFRGRVTNPGEAPTRGRTEDKVKTLQPARQLSELHDSEFEVYRGDRARGRSREWRGGGDAGV